MATPRKKLPPRLGGGMRPKTLPIPRGKQIRKGPSPKAKGREIMERSKRGEVPKREPPKARGFGLTIRFGGPRPRKQR